MLVAQGRLLSNKVTINVDYGEIRSYWSDQRVRDEEGKVFKKSFLHSELDSN